MRQVCADNGNHYRCLGDALLALTLTPVCADVGVVRRATRPGIIGMRAAGSRALPLACYPLWGPFDNDQSNGW